MIFIKVSARLFTYMEIHMVSKTLIDAMFKAGGHFAYSRSRRHPSAKPFIFGAKNRVEIFDLEKTAEMLERAKSFVQSIGATGKQILFVGGKNEAREIVKNAAESLGLPYVASRWLGGTFTNFSEIKRRVEKMETWISERERGELAKYTKKERLLIDREIIKLEAMFGGLTLMKELPKAIFVIDPRREHIAVEEAKKLNIPVVALASSDCDLTLVDYVIPANDSSVSSVSFFVKEIAAAYKAGKNTAPAPSPAPVAQK